MKIIIFFILILISIKSKLIQIPLYTENGIPFISLKIGESLSSFNLIFDTSLHRSLLASQNCDICIRKGYNTSNSKKILSNQTQIKYYYTFYGNEYEDSFNLITKNENLQSNFSFISFTNVSYTYQISISGFFGLSFTNYNFNTSKKIFGLQYYSGKVILDIGELNTNIVKNYSLLKNYSVSFNQNKTQWFIEVNSITIKNIPARNKEKQKLIFDTSTYNIYIPKIFFFDNIDLILPKTGKCQVQITGTFLCKCNEKFKSLFSDFVFSIDKETLFINVTDYVFFDSSVSGNNCYISFIVNYYNDLWIIGNSILNNYYTIFDIDNNLVKLYDKKVKLSERTEFIFMMFFLILFICFIIFAAYIIYKKYNNGQNFPEPLI